MFNYLFVSFLNSSYGQDITSVWENAVTENAHPFANNIKPSLNNNNNNHHKMICFVSYNRGSCDF